MSVAEADTAIVAIAVVVRVPSVFEREMLLLSPAVASTAVPTSSFRAEHLHQSLLI
jgi:hypothetical protein